jgi:4-amino-4-deoxy-L-arabinose transferase-like glycosyltransferase
MILSRYWKLWIAFISLLYFAAIGVDTMDVDASQYASMSREMKESGSYLEIYEQGNDYLDKPPFLFWINALSMRIFGENNFAFKFPSILFALIGIISTIQLARLYYHEEIARISGFLLAASQAIFLITNDIRTDTILMGWTAMALWLLTKWYKEGGLKFFLFGAIAVGGGMITKGPIAVMVPVFALGSQILLERKFTFILRKEYLLGILIIALILTPMCIGLYRQFDLHPEKIMYGKQGTSGLRFFFWTQSFGRITGESVWDNGAPFSFLFENLLWGFLPWTLVMIGGIVSGWFFIFKSKFRFIENQEGLSIAGFTITYCALASSNYQLPHYIYVVLPLLAIITAKFIYDIHTKKSTLNKTIEYLQYLILLILSIFPGVILYFVFPSNSTWIWLLAVLPLILTVFYLYQFNREKYVLTEASVVMIISLNIFISLWFYPSLLKYQSGNAVGKKIDVLNIAKDQFYLYKYSGSSRNIHFYAKRIVQQIEDPIAMKKELYVLTAEEGLSTIKNSIRPYEIILEGEDYPVSQLTPEFLNIKTRTKVTRKYYLIKLKVES